MSIVKNYSRLIVIGDDVDYGINVNPPNETQVINEVYDPNNSQLTLTGVLTPDRLVQVKNDAIAFFNSRFGVNFAISTPLNIPGLPPAIQANGFAMFPYGTATAPINMIFDSNHIDRGATGFWNAFQFGWACPALADGVFQSGLYAGNTYNAGDVISYFLWVFAPTQGGSLTSQYKTDVITCRSPWVSKNVPDQQGYTDTLSRLECLDENGNVGYYFEDYEFSKDPVTNDVGTKFRAIFTWNPTSTTSSSNTNSQSLTGRSKIMFNRFNLGSALDNKPEMPADTAKPTVSANPTVGPSPTRRFKLRI